MFNEIKLTNFKCFQGEVAFPLSKINLLTGINGRGKSSFLQSLLLFKQSVEKDKYTTALHLNGDYVRLETFEDMINRNAPMNIVNNNVNDYFSIEFLYDNIRFMYELNKKEDIDSGIVKIQDCMFNDIDAHYICEDEKDFILNLLPNEAQWEFITEIPNSVYPFQNDKNYHPYNKDFFKTIHYISADRIGPLFRHDKKPTNGFLTLTPNGDNATSIFVKSKLLDIKTGVCIGENPKLQHQMNAWLSYIFDTNVKIEVSEYEGTLFLKFEIDNEKHKPTNVGFGYSYILPILLAGMIAEDGHTLIIENPEAHLHPKAQARLTEFLARVSTTGVQIFVESHSEHILNGLRVAIAKHEIGVKNTDVSVLYFANDAPNGYFHQIPILENGEIEAWHDGFFDQANLDYKVLYDY
jgi:predicted ATPase